MKIKVLTILFIAALIFTDFMALRNLFLQLNADHVLYIDKTHQYAWFSEVNTFSLASAVLLEGTPTFAGFALSVILDKAKYKKNDKSTAWWVFVLSVLAFGVLATGLIWMRLTLMGKQNGRDSLNIFLIFLPFATSLGAFSASLFAFKSDSITELSQRLEKLHNKYLAAQSRFLESLNETKYMRERLWSSLSTEKIEELEVGLNSLPSESDEDQTRDSASAGQDAFREECFKRIRAKLFSNTITEFPNQIENYNSKIEGKLQEFISEMARYATDSCAEISSLDIKTVLNEYDADIENNEDNKANAWDYSICGSALEAELKKVLNNAVVVAQFKTVVKPYYKERAY